MKIECIREQLGDALGRASKIAGKNITLPVLSGVYLDATQKNLSIKATNLDLGISIVVPAKIIEPGALVVSAGTISSLVSSLPPKEKNVTMVVEKQVLELKTPNINTKIKLLALEDFPLIPEVGEGGFSLPARDLVWGIRSVIFAAAQGNIKPEICSVAITAEKDFLVFAATDSFRLAEKKIKVKGIANFKQIIIPQKNAAEIIRIFDQGEEDVNVSVQEHQIALRSQNIYLTSRVVEGNFPDYRQIIPKQNTTQAVLLKQDLTNALKTSLIFSNTFDQLALKVSPKTKTFVVESNNANVGESATKIEAALEGEDISLNINQKYFSDCLQSISVDSVSLNFSGQAKPLVIQGIGEASFLYLMMPMNQS